MKAQINALILIVLGLLLLTILGFAQEVNSQIVSRPAAVISPQFGTGPLLKEPPKLTPEQMAQYEQALEELWQRRRARFQLPKDPDAHPEDVIVSPPAFAVMNARAIAPRGPGDFEIFRNTLMNDTFTNNQTSSTNEPSVGANGRLVFYTGNWYASLSGDYGQTFSFIDPFTNFPDPPTGGFCCDQVVYYERTRGIMCWYLQYVKNALGNNAIRLAIANNQANLANNNWYWYDITPQILGYDDGVWFDFPDLSASDDFLYITTNFGAGPDAAIVFRLDLDDLATASDILLTNFTSDLPNLRATHGATSTMYIGTQVDSNTLRIYSWPESSESPSSVDQDVDMWFIVTSVATSPDGTNWVARDFHDILAAWVGGGKIGFMWGSAQGGDFPWPNVRYARFNIAGLSLFDQGQIWNSDYAWAYPSAHPNARGDVGGTIAAGGGGTNIPYPGVWAWIADDFNSDTIEPLENAFVAVGNSGPISNRWGDYFTARRSVPYGDTWVGTGFVLNGGQTGGFTQPRFVWFGREQDSPPSSNIIYVDLANVSGYEDGSSANPYNTVTEGHFAAVSGDQIIIRAGDYSESVTLSTAVTVISEGGTVTIGEGASSKAVVFSKKEGVKK